MPTAALLYHDIVEGTDWTSSGFPGADADIYKLPSKLFREHLREVRSANPRTIFTFDDGGVSAYERTADMLEAEGVRGIFFIATDWIGKPGFLARSQIRELRNRGHLIGTHSCSHPPRISHCSWSEMCREWADSRATLDDILGESITSGSVPGGFYTTRVAKAAAAVGLSTLFTSEPTWKVRRIEGCVVVGRYSIQRSTSAITAGALARTNFFQCSSQSVLWSAKKLAKACGGNGWLTFRRWVISRRQSAGNAKCS